MKWLYASLLMGLLVLTFFAVERMADKNEISNRETNSNLSLSIESLRINLQEGDPPSLHPHRNRSATLRVLEKALFECLVRQGEAGKIELAAAENVEISNTYDRYSFKIRPHLWSNGEPVTAAHFEQAWKEAISPNSLCQRVDLFYIIKNARGANKGTISLDEVGVRAENRDTLVVELEYPAPYFLDLISHPLFAPLHHQEKEPSCFNGPFVIEQWQRGRFLTFVRNPQYWDHQNVLQERIHFSMIEDSTTELALFETGELDWMGEPFTLIPSDSLSSNRFGKNLKSNAITRTYMIHLNTTQFPLNSKKIRQALSHSIDRTALTRTLFVGSIPYKSPVPQTLSLLKGEQLYQEGVSGDALRLFNEGLEELGLTRDHFPPLILTYSPAPGQKSVAESLQQTWQSLFGIHVNLEGCDRNNFNSKLDHRQLQIGGLRYSAAYNDPIYFLEMFKYKESAYNASVWDNELYRSLLNRAVQSRDLKERENYLRQAERLLVEETPVIPICTDQSYYITRDQLAGIEIDPIGGVNLKKLRLLRKFSQEK